MDPMILVVEDNEDNADICQTALRHFGFNVTRAADGAEGLRLARELRPDLILLDLSLPRISGWDVAESLRRDETTAELPIIIWSAHDLWADRLRAAQLGCDGYLAKPCDVRHLVQEVQRVLRPATTPTAFPAGRRFAVRLVSQRTIAAAAAAMVSVLPALALVRWHRRRNHRRRWSPFVSLFRIAAGAAA